MQTVSFFVHISCFDVLDTDLNPMRPPSPGYSGSDPEPGPVPCKPRSPEGAGRHPQTGPAAGQSAPRHTETHQHGGHAAAVCGEWPRAALTRPGGRRTATLR